MSESDEYIRQAFSVLDRNGDGRIERSEFVKTLQILDGRFSTAECDAMFEAADANMDAYINIDEFLQWVFGKHEVPLCLRLANLSMLTTGVAEGVWRSNQGESGYFALRWDLKSTATLEYSNSPPIHSEPKTFRKWSFRQVELGDVCLLQFDFEFLDVEGRVFVQKEGSFQGWFKSARDHGVYQGEAVRDWNPRAVSATAPLKGVAQGEWRDENGETGFFALKWNLEEDPPQVLCCSNERGNPSRSFRLNSAQLTSFGLIHIDFAVGDLKEAFVDISWDGSFQGWFEGPRDHGTYFGTRVEGDRWSCSAPRPQKHKGSAMEYPEYWEKRGGAFRNVVEIDSEDEVFSGMQVLLSRTFKRFPDGRAWSTRDRHGGVCPVSLRLRKVYRVEDSSLWWQYHRRRWQINSHRGYGIDCVPLLLMEGSGSPKTTAEKSAFLSNLDELNNEHYLFHGTSPEAATSISEQGFRVDLAGKFAGTAFGPGSYLAESCSKSDEYAGANDDGLYAILVCRVCCGKFARTEDFVFESDDSKALAQEVAEGELYDFLLGDREAKRGTYREFISFSGAAIYPEYIVAYERVPYGLIGGKWINSRGQSGQFSIQWDPSKPDDSYGIEIVNCGRTITPKRLTATVEPEGVCIWKAYGLSVSFGFSDVMASVLIYVSERGSLVFRGAFSSSRDFGFYRGYKNVLESESIEGSVQNDDDLEGLVLPESGEIDGTWKNSSDDVGTCRISWEDCSNFEFMSLSGNECVVCEYKVEKASFQHGCHILDLVCESEAGQAHLEIFMFGTGCMAFVGSYTKHTDRGLFKGMKPCG